MVVVKYSSWTVEELLLQIELQSASRKFVSIGLFDHGSPGEFCLLKSFCGGAIKLGSFMDPNTHDAVTKFFLKLASHVRRPENCSAVKSKVNRIDVLACNVATGPGVRLLEYLEQITDTHFAMTKSHTGVDANEIEIDFKMQTDNIDVAADYFIIEKIQHWWRLRRQTPSLPTPVACSAVYNVSYGMMR